MDKIIIKNASRDIKGVRVLDNINLELDRGGIYGFIGSNGSGKTMLFRAICGLIKLTEGEIEVLSKKIRKDISFPESLGVIIESIGFWDEYTGFENLYLLSRIKKIIGKKEIMETLTRVGLNPKDKRTYKKYSLGMKQRLGIAEAIMEKPELLVLDEPTNALDDEGVETVRNILFEEKERGATILIASHNKEDLSILCDRIFKRSEGRLREITNEIKSV